jgi:hypothetical protein
MATNINISPAISPDILDNISKSETIKAFGDQTKNKIKEKIIVGGQTTIEDINSKQNDLTKREQQAGVNKGNTLKKAEYDYNTNQITEQHYNEIIIAAQNAYEVEIATIKIEKEKLQQDKNNIVNNPFQKIKDNQKKLKSSIKLLKQKTQEFDNKAKKDLTKQVISNATKTLAPVIALQLTNSFISIISQRKKLENLVNQVNNYIDTQVKDQTTVTIATNLRNNAVTLINNNINKLQLLEKVIKTITNIVTIINITLTVIERILNLPIPALLPIKVQLQPTLQRILRLVSAINSILIIVNNLLGNEILELIKLREQLKQISLKLDNKILDNLDNQEFTDLINTFAPVGVGEFLPYKGFNFKLKEEQNQKFVVKGNKRRYAVAIDSDGIEVLKSEFSFTLDPNDLIDQLKLIIDQQNLQG